LSIGKEGAPELEIRVVSQHRNGGAVLEMLPAEGATTPQERSGQRGHSAGIKNEPMIMQKIIFCDACIS
jgi:hypothetical protein